MKPSISKLLATSLLLLGCVGILTAQNASVDDTYRASEVDVPVKGTILIITDNDYNDTELLYPYYRLVEAGYIVTIATPEGGDIAGYNTAPIKNTVPLERVDVSLFDGLYLPGGHAPAKLRENKVVLEKVKHFLDENKPVAAICHGPQILAKMGVLTGKQVAAWPDLDEEMREAGATFVNHPVVKDGNLVTARMPGDLPAHMHEFLSMLK